MRMNNDGDLVILFTILYQFHLIFHVNLCCQVCLSLTQYTINLVYTNRFVLIVCKCQDSYLILWIFR